MSGFQAFKREYIFDKENDGVQGMGIFVTYADNLFLKQRIAS